jgi:hypothetical protein
MPNKDGNMCREKILQRDPYLRIARAGGSVYTKGMKVSGVQGFISRPYFHNAMLQVDTQRVG